MTGPLVDRFGRVHRYLRVSVTDRCNFRCTYCMPKDGLTWTPRAEVLSYEEIARIVQVMVAAGVHKVRLTGGEPTMRADIEALVRALGVLEGLRDLAMTTNGLTLATTRHDRTGTLAERLARAGLTRVNVSIDSLQADRFAAITRGGDLGRVLAGIDAARAAGLTPIKLNVVLMEGVNDDELADLVEFFAPHAATTVLRFIEVMPFGQHSHRCVPAAEVRRRLSQRYTVKPGAPTAVDAGPATAWHIGEHDLRLGFISPLSEHFCATCNRLRLMVDGHLRTCLAHEDTPSLRDLLRAGASSSDLDAAVRAMVLGKPEGHRAEVDGGVPFEGIMTRIGG